MYEMTNRAAERKLRMTATLHVGVKARIAVLYHLFRETEQAAGRDGSKRAFAARLNSSETTLSNWTKGQRPLIDTGIEISRVFGVTLDWLYTGDPDGLSRGRWREIEQAMDDLGNREECESL